MILFYKLGPSAYPILLLLLVVLYITVRKTWELFILKRVERPLTTEHALNAIPVLCAAMIAFGFAGSFFGLSSMTESVLVAHTLDPRVIAGGISMALLPVILTLLIFSVFAIVWFVLRMRFKYLLDTQTG